MSVVDDITAEVLARTHGDINVLRQIVDQLDQELSASPLERTMRLWDVSASQLGTMFGVSRQAVNKWLAEGPPASRSAQIALLGQCNDLLDRWVKRERIPAVVRRPVSVLDGRTRLEIATDGDFERLHAELVDTFDLSRIAP